MQIRFLTFEEDLDNKVADEVILNVINMESEYVEYLNCLKVVDEIVIDENTYTLECIELFLCDDCSCVSVYLEEV